MNQSTVEPAYLIAPVPGVWGWSFNLCLFASGIFSDLLLIKVCLTLGFSFMLVHALTGLPSASDGIATDEPRVLFLDMVAWASLNALLHGFGAYRLIRDERSVALRNEEEERVWPDLAVRLEVPYPRLAEHYADGPEKSLVDKRSLAEALLKDLAVRPGHTPRATSRRQREGKPLDTLHQDRWLMSCSSSRKS